MLPRCGPIRSPPATSGSTSSSSTAIARLHSSETAQSICARATTTISASRYPAVVKALAKLPDDTVIDGEVVAFDQEGRPSFNALQNYGSAAGPVVYYVFDVMVLADATSCASHWRSGASCSRRRCCRS